MPTGHLDHPAQDTGRQPVGDCSRCGRVFYSMPCNRRDNYRPAKDVTVNDFGGCGGEVVPRQL